MDDFNATEELANLNDKLEATRGKFDVWNEDIITEMKDWFVQFDANIEKHEAHLAELKESLCTLKERNKSNQDAAKEGVTALEIAREQLNSIKKRIDVTVAEKTDAETELKSEEDKMLTEKEALLATEAALKQRTNEMSKSAVMSKEILGLSFQKAPGQKMQVVFRQIDPNNTEAPFVLSVSIVSGKYEVSDCDPDIANLPDLVQKLNDSNDFRSFLIAVRSRFQKLI